MHSSLLSLISHFSYSLLSDLYIGAKVPVNSRLLSIVDYSDTTTEAKLANRNEKYVFSYLQGNH